MTLTLNPSNNHAFTECTSLARLGCSGGYALLRGTSVEGFPCCVWLDSLSGMYFRMAYATRWHMLQKNGPPPGKASANKMKRPSHLHKVPGWTIRHRSSISMADVAECTHGRPNITEQGQIKAGEDDFVPSKLGTKQYWDKAYQTELELFRDIGDVGEIWFGEQSMCRVIRWMEKAEIPKDAPILDIGTGNGVLLLELAKEGYTNLTGIDYSAASVALAKDVLQAEDFNNVSVKEVDFLSCSGELKDFHVCVDKGTFDAISLNPERTQEVRRHYVQALSEALQEGGYFVITSCNWTKEQLLQRFSSGFEFVQQLPTPSIQFGGRTGHNVTALIFKRLP